MIKIVCATSGFGSKVARTVLPSAMPSFSSPLLALLTACLTLSSCGGPHVLTVGSKNFTEQLVLGEIAAQQIERKTHVRVDRKFNLGGTLLTHEAIKKGDIDLYPEYTGTALSVVLKKPAPQDPAHSYELAKREYLARFQLVWLPPLGFDDTFAMVVRGSDAAKFSSQKISDAVKHDWRLGIGYEFLTRKDGLKKLDDTYHLRWQGSPTTMDLGLLYQALRQNRVDMAAANSTDAALTDPRFSVLQDDRHAFPPYNACFVLRKEIAEGQPAVELALTMLSNHINEDAMRQMNRRVDVDHQPVARVAKDFLATQP